MQHVATANEPQEGPTSCLGGCSKGVELIGELPSPALVRTGRLLWLEAAAAVQVRVVQMQSLAESTEIGSPRSSPCVHSQQRLAVTVVRVWPMVLCAACTSPCAGVALRKMAE